MALSSLFLSSSNLFFGIGEMKSLKICFQRVIQIVTLAHLPVAI